MDHHEHLRSLVGHESMRSGSEAILVAGDARSGKPNKRRPDRVSRSLQKKSRDRAVGEA